MGGQADIGIRVFLDDAASAGLSNINSGLGRMGNLVGAAATGFGKMGAAQAAGTGIMFGAIAAFALFAGAVVYSVKQAEQLQEAMTLVELNVHGATAVMQPLTNAIIGVADSSKFTTTAIAEAVAKMGTYGFTATDMLAHNNQLITSMVNLAEATNSGVTPAAELLSRTMQIFGLSADQATHAANVLDFTFKNGQNDISGLSSALMSVGPVAHVLGVSLDDTAVALDLLGQAGIKGSTAGLDLRYMLSGLVDPTTKAATELQVLGIITVGNVPKIQALVGALNAAGDAASKKAAAGFDGSYTSLQALYKAGQAIGAVPLNESFGQWGVSVGALNNKLFNSQGQFLGLKNLLDLVSKSISHMTEQGKEDALGQLFNVRSGQGAAALVSNLQHLDAEWTKLQGVMKQTSAQRDAEKVMADFGNAVKALVTTFQSAAGQIGLTFLPALTHIVVGLNQIIAPFAAAGNSATKTIATFLRVGLVVSAIAVPIALLIAAATGLLGPLGLIAVIALGVVAGVMLLTAGVMAAANWFHGFIASANPVAGFLRGLGATFQELGGQVMSQVGGAFRVLGINMSALRPVLEQLRVALIPIAQVLGGLLVVSVGIGIAALHGLVSVFSALVVGIAIAVRGVVMVITGMVQVISGIFGILHGIFTLNGTMIMASLRQLGAGIGNIIGGAFLAIIGVVVGVFGAVIGFVVHFVQGIISYFQNLANVLVGHSIIPDMMKAILQSIVSGLAGAISAVLSFVGNIISNFVSMGARVVAVAVQAWAAFRAAVTVGIQFAVSMVASGAASMVSRVLSLGSQIVSSASSAWNGFRNAVSNGVNAAASLASSLPGRIVGALGGLAGMLFGSGANAMGQFAAGLGSMLGAVVGQVEAAANAVANFLSHHSPAKMGPLHDDDTWMPNMMKMFAKGIQEHAPLIQKAATGVAGNISNVPSIAKLGAASSGSSVPVGHGTGTTNIYFQLDGKTVAQATMNMLTGQLQMNGLGRALR